MHPIWKILTTRRAAPRSATTDYSIGMLRECFDLDETSPSGIVWRERPLSHFPNSWRHKWFTSRFTGKPAGSPNGKGYWSVKIGKRLHVAHRIVYALHYGGLQADLHIDHIDGNPGNNQPHNLRLATNQQNCCNRKVRWDSATGRKGVHPTRYGTYYAKVHVKGKSVFLGIFKTQDEAQHAYAKAAGEAFGSFYSTGT